MVREWQMCVLAHTPKISHLLNEQRSTKRDSQELHSGSFYYLHISHNKTVACL